jgi:hypothetical protein
VSSPAVAPSRPRRPAPLRHVEGDRLPGLDSGHPTLCLVPVHPEVAQLRHQVPPGRAKDRLAPLPARSWFLSQCGPRDGILAGRSPYNS